MSPYSGEPVRKVKEMKVLPFYEQQEIEQLLLGRKVTKVDSENVVLDDGTKLKFVGNEGCGGCGNGWYELDSLNGIDNVITKVTFANDPDEDYRTEPGSYTIFVFAENTQVNLATFTGSDGNGYYGSGYYIHVS